MLKQVKTKLEKYRIYIATMSRDNMEVKWSVGYREFHIDIVVMKVTLLGLIFLLPESINKQL
jgi:hypothetical protein